MQAVLTLDDEAQTCALAAKVAGQITAPAVICLDGALGAGKSVFARAFLTALGESGDIPSPTFTLVQVYDERGPDGCDVWHMDAYRIESPKEALELGIEDAFDSAICLIEWPGKIADLLPGRRLDIFIERVDGNEDARVVTLSGDLYTPLAL